MTLPNDSITVTPGSGATVATHTVDGKEYQVVMQAGPSGHVEGSLDSYCLSIPPQAVGANKLHFSLYNGTGSAFMKVRGIWVVPALDVAITGAVAIRMDWFRTSSDGTLGTVATYNSATIGPNFSPKDTGNVTLPATVVCRAVPTVTPTLATWLYHTYHHTEEAPNSMSVMSQEFNVLPNPERGEQELILRPGQGLLGRQGSVAGVGNVGFLVAFTMES